MEFFNPRNKQYKSFNRAIPAGTTIALRICMPRNYRCEGAELVIHTDFQAVRYIDMKWDGMCGEDAEWWKIEYKAEKEGLYWYHFEYKVPFSVGAITKRDYDCCGRLGWAGTDWQITVFNSEYKTPDWLRGGIIYQIFPDRFSIGSHGVKNPYNDRIVRTDYENDPYWKPVSGKVLNNDYFGGNLEGIQEKLPYLAKLGVSCIYLNPIFEAHANHRYNTADYKKIDGMLGDENEFAQLCREARKYNIGIILDGVFSHVGQDSKYFNMFRRYKEDGAYNSRQSKYYNWFKFNRWPDDYKAWWNIKLLPEINEENPDYLEYICGKDGVARKWLKSGAKGWRLDVADELPDEFLDSFRKAVKAENSSAYILGEVWEDATNKISYSQRRRYLLGEQLDSVMNYPYARGIIDFIRNGSTEKFMNTVLTIIENYPRQSVHTLMNHIGTHDTPRALTALAGEDSTGKDRQWQSEHRLSEVQRKKGAEMLRLATLLQFTLPGVPCIYYGDEVGMEGYSDPFNRRFFPWNNIDAKILDWYRRLGEVRKNSAVFSSGSFVPIWSPEGTFCFIRKRDSHETLVAVNRSENEAAIKIPEEFAELKATIGVSPCAGSLSLPAMSCSLIEI